MSSPNNFDDYFDLLFPGGLSNISDYALDDGKEYPPSMLTSNSNVETQVSLVYNLTSLPVLNSKQQTSTPDLGLGNESTTIISMSTAFNASSNFGDGPPDMTLVSQDLVHFYVRNARLTEASESHFNNLLPTGSLDTTLTPIHVKEDAVTLNIVLHIVYDIPFRHYSPSLDLLLEAAGALKKYGVPLQTKLAAGTPFFEELIGKVALAPIEVYALAAENDLFHLASDASSYLLSFPIAFLSDEMCYRIGPIYLLMLFNLQTGRLRVLQSLVTLPPPEHGPTLLCGWTDYQCLKTAWSLASASFIFNATPGTYIMFGSLDTHRNYSYSQISLRVKSGVCSNLSAYRCLAKTANDASQNAFKRSL